MQVESLEYGRIELEKPQSNYQLWREIGMLRQEIADLRATQRFLIEEAVARHFEDD